jgi:hypothetical protein
MMRHVIGRGFTELDKFEIEHMGIIQTEGNHADNEVEIRICFVHVGGLWRKTPVVLGEFIDDDHSMLVGRIPCEDTIIVFTLEDECDLVTVQLFDAASQMRDGLPPIDWLNE